MTAVKFIHTLGPPGTNCEKAAMEWISEKSFRNDCKVVTHTTVEDAIKATLKDQSCSVTVGCVVYPDLHHVVFDNLNEISLLEVFMSDTFDMILAGKGDTDPPLSVASHAAPLGLIRKLNCKILDATSNVAAAEMCFGGLTDACITTRAGATKYGLQEISNFGPIRMGFTVHGSKHLISAVK